MSYLLVLFQVKSDFLASWRICVFAWKWGSVLVDFFACVTKFLAKAVPWMKGSFWVPDKRNAVHHSSCLPLTPVGRQRWTLVLTNFGYSVLAPRPWDGTTHFQVFTPQLNLPGSTNKPWIVSLKSWILNPVKSIAILPWMHWIWSNPVKLTMKINHDRQCRIYCLFYYGKKETPES